MKTWQAILLAIALIVIFGGIDMALGTGNVCTLLMVLGASMWMAIDSKKIELKKSTNQEFSMGLW